MFDSSTAMGELFLPSTCLPRGCI